MATGNGAYVVHCLLERHFANYRLVGYHPYLTLVPILLRAAVSCKGAKAIHCAPDYAIFHHTNSLPLIVTFHNYVLDRWMQSHSSWLQRLHYSTDLRLWTHMAVRKARYITAVSHFLANLIKQDLGLTKPVRVIYNGINVEHFKPQPGAKSGQKEINVFFSGNLTRRKGAHWLPAIARRLAPNVHIYYTSGLRTKNILASEKLLHPVGRIPYSEMPKRYGEMDILLMPTVREGFGLAVAEAMACGRPVVASNCSSIPELLDDGKGGYLCPIGDVASFAEKINILAESDNLRREMGEYNRAKAEKMFAHDRMVNEYGALFEQVLSE